MLINWITLYTIWQSNYFLRNFPLTSIWVDNMLLFTFIYEVYALMDRFLSKCRYHPAKISYFPSCVEMYFSYCMHFTDL